MFSILIPTFNNLDYLKLCIKSIEKNSKFKHQIIIHVNEGTDGTLEFVKNSNYEFTHSEKNIGMPMALNRSSKLSKFDYILISHDDFYYCPEWDIHLSDEIKTTFFTNEFSEAKQIFIVEIVLLAIDSKGFISTRGTCL